MDELVGSDPLGGVDDRAGDDCANADPGAIFGTFDDESLLLVVAWILPLEHDLDTVADLEGFGAVAGNRLFHERR